MMVLNREKRLGVDTGLGQFRKTCFFFLLDTPSDCLKSHCILLLMRHSKWFDTNRSFVSLIMCWYVHYQGHYQSVLDKLPIGLFPLETVVLLHHYAHSGFSLSTFQLGLAWRKEKKSKDLLRLKFWCIKCQNNVCVSFISKMY